MDFALIYLVVLCGALALLLLQALGPFLYALLEPRVRVNAAQFTHSRVRFGLGMTGLQLFGLFLYATSNALLLALGISDRAKLEQRTAAVASANFMLLFLGGRTNPLADFVGVPLPSYYFAHRCIGVVATCEALLHSGLVLVRRRSFDQLTKSGCIAIGCLLAVLLSSLWLRKRSGQFFGLFHLVCSIGTLAGLVWHATLLRSATARIPIFVSCGMLGSTHVYRLTAMFIFGRTQGTVSHVWKDGQVVRLKVRPDQPVRVFPGCYFYVFFKGPLPFYNLFHGYPMMPYWANPGQFAGGSTTALSFLASQAGHHHRSLRSIVGNRRIRLEGPYGKDLQLHTFETVVLTAKGMGIIGILPFALHLASRRRHDHRARDMSVELRDSSEPVFGDLSRNVDMIWWLDHKDQQKWVHEQLKVLQQVDSKKLLVVWCIYPSSSPSKEELPFLTNGYWAARSNFGFEQFSEELRQEARYPGKNILLACGETSFVRSMRKIVLENTTSKRLIKFAEVEYSPSPGVVQCDSQSDLVADTNEESIEMSTANTGRSVSRREVTSWGSEDTLVAAQYDEMDITDGRSQKPKSLV